MIRHARILTAQLALYMEEIILTTLILLNVLDFFEILPPFWDFVKKIISWSVLGFLLYKVSLTKIFFGEKHKKFDLWIVLTYFTLIVKNLIEYIVVARKFLFQNIENYIGFVFADKATATAYGFKSIVVNNFYQLNLSLIVPLKEGAAIISQHAQNLSLLSPELFFRLYNNTSEMFIALVPKTLDGTLIPLYNSLITNKAIIQSTFFYIGIILLFILSIIMSFKIITKKNSMFYAITKYEESNEDSIGERTTKVFVIYAILLFFFIVVFNLMMEWLAIAIDAPLLMIGLISYPFVLHKHHKKFNTDSFIFKVGDFGSTFYEKFIGLFHSRKSLFLGISGMLVLHLLTDIGNYILPFVLSFHDALYLTRFDGSTHMPFIQLINSSIQQMNLINIIDIASIIVIYVFSIIAILFLLILPGYMWYKLLIKEKIEPTKFSNWILALFFPAIIVQLIFPALKISAINQSSIIGVNITTQIVTVANTLLLREVAGGLILLLIIIYLAAKSDLLKRITMLIPIFGSMIFFGLYLFYYLISCVKYYITQAWTFLSGNHPIMGIMFYIFLIINVIFYIGGFAIFCYKSIVEEEEIVEK